MDIDNEELVRILYIEPSQKAFQSIQKYLQTWFGSYIEIIWKSIYANGVEEIKKGHYDLLITELDFPDNSQTQLEVLEELVELAGPHEMPLVVFSQSSDKKLPVQCFEMGVNEFFSKKRIKKSLLESRFRNLFREIYRKKVISKQIDDSLRRFQDMYGVSQNEIHDLNSMIKQFKKDLELEYQEKARLDLEKKKMQNVFGMYVDPSVVESLLNNTLSLDQRGKTSEISVLFSDIRGYTSLSEKQNPQQVISFLNEYFTAMTEVILGYNGMIDKYIGDSIMCLFGAPVERPNHREDAIDCAMEMIQVFELWQPKWESLYGFVPQIGIGIASGDVVVGNVGSFQKLSYTAVGDTVNMASRLESMAKPMEVLISEDFYARLPNDYAKKYSYKELVPTAIKGKSGLHKMISVTQRDAQN